jgi:hypothetical protein
MRMLRFRRIPLLLVLLAAVVVACDWGGGALAKSKPVSWKVIDDALLRVNDAPIKDWNIYQTGKKQDPLLLQMGNRFLLIEVHDRRVFEIDPSKIERKSEDVLWDLSERPAQPLATSDWMANDMGAAFKIEAKIDSENRLLDLQLPHPPDIGDLPQRSAAPTRRRY